MMQTQLLNYFDHWPLLYYVPHPFEPETKTPLLAPIPVEASLPAVPNPVQTLYTVANTTAQTTPTKCSLRTPQSIEPLVSVGAVIWGREADATPYIVVVRAS